MLPVRVGGRLLLSVPARLEPLRLLAALRVPGLLPVPGLPTAVRVLGVRPGLLRRALLVVPAVRIGLAVRLLLLPVPGLRVPRLGVPRLLPLARLLPVAPCCG
ncbi:hypothetical protein [Kitasatospora cheerisanensis]|uniref:hypothetical protein n=1 Tax=Kitasatospora cheerisanensis TaxID=81942 RepID=UPI000560357D|nr:hypothetical protein [Kitasatospora cheerisanensis]